MNLYWKRLDAAFIIGLIGILFAPHTRLLFFSPFLVVLYYKRPLVTALLGSLFCGLVVDILSSEAHLGMVGINYILVTALLYRFKYNFFPDSITTLPLLTFLFGTLSALVDMILMFAFDHPMSIHGDWMWTDLIVLPTWDAAYAFVFFVLPGLLFGKRQLRGSDYFSR